MSRRACSAVPGLGPALPRHHTVLPQCQPRRARPTPELSAPAPRPKHRNAPLKTHGPLKRAGRGRGRRGTASAGGDMRPAGRPAAALSKAATGEVGCVLRDVLDALLELRRHLRAGGLDALHEVLDAGGGELSLSRDVLARRRGLLVEVAAERLDLALDAVATLRSVRSTFVRVLRTSRSKRLRAVVPRRSNLRRSVSMRRWRAFSSRSALSRVE